MNVVDTHCHLDHVSEDTDAVLEEASAAGVSWVVDIGMGTQASRACVERAKASGGRSFAAVGVHPNDLAEFREDRAGTMDRLRALCASDVVVAVGETGLDFYRDHEEPSVQEEAFRAHIALAKEQDKVLVIHTRDAQERVLAVLDDEGAPDRVVMHCFSGDAEHARACVHSGYFCSFAGNVTFSKAEDVREAARVVPDGLLLVETDSPFLAPHPLRGKPNRPAHVVHTARALAELRGVAEAELFERLTRNAEHVFRVG